MLDTLRKAALCSVCRKGFSIAALITAAVIGSSRDISATSVPSAITLEWTAPGDDGDWGLATRYDVRYSIDPITPESFATATPVDEAPEPAFAGVRQQVRIRGLEAGRLYHFALRTVDENGNWSDMSNVVDKVAPDLSLNASLFDNALSVPMPNPASWRTVFELSLPRPTDIRIDVHDVTGRLVKTIALGSYPAGITPIYWDLRETRGYVLRPGNYWIRARIGGRSVGRRLTVVSP